MGRRRTAAVLTAAALLLGVAALADIGPAGLPVLGPDCTTTVGGGATGLSRDEARAAAAEAATAVREGRDAGELARPGVLSCRTSRPDRVDEPEGADGLTPRAQRLRAELEGAFGRQSLGGFAPGGVQSGHIAGSAHYDGRALDVFFRPVTPEGTARGWVLAHWLVAHADDLDVATVIFDRQVWSARRSADGWRPYAHPSGDTDNPVLAHEDHVHVDVGR